MSTIYSRCYALSKEKKIESMPDHSQMMEIGLKVIKKYKFQNEGKFPKKVPAPDYVGDFKVAYYPAHFTEEIDNSILHFFCGKKEKRVRKKILVHELQK